MSFEGKAVGAERVSNSSPRATRQMVDDDDVGSVDSGWDGSGSAPFNFAQGMGHFDTEEVDKSTEKQTPSGMLTPTPQYTTDHLMPDCTLPTKSPTDRRVASDERMAQSWPPRTPGPTVSALDEMHGDASAGFTLDPSIENKGILAGVGRMPVGILPRIPLAPKRGPKSQAEISAQTEPETTQNVIISNHATVSNPAGTFCTVVINGVQLIQCNIPKGEDAVTHAEVTLKKDVCLFGERKGCFLQLMFYSPNFPAKPEFHIHGTLELLDNEDQIITTLYLGLIEDAKQVEKKQMTLPLQAVKAKIILSSIAPVRVGPNELQLVEEICDVLRNTRINPGRGSLPSVLVQHRARESPLYEKVVGKYYQNSWHTFMKAHDNVFTLFHYSQKEIQERRLGPFAKFNEARIVLKEHEQGDWRSADELAAIRHAQAEEGLKDFLVKLLEQRDYDQRELLEVLHGNVHFNHFLSPTFSILMRTLCRHKGTFISSTDADQSIRIGLARPDRESVETTGVTETISASKLVAQTPQPKLQFQNPPQQYTETTPQQTQRSRESPGSLSKHFQDQTDHKRNTTMWGHTQYEPHHQQEHQTPDTQETQAMASMTSNGMLVASAVPVQTTVSQNMPINMLFDQRGMIQRQPPQQQFVQLGSSIGGTMPLLDQNAAVVLLKGHHQPLIQPQFSNQQLLLVNQPSGSDGNWVVTPQTPPQQDLYPQPSPSAPPLGSNPSTPGDQPLSGGLYPQYLLSGSTTSY